jgi:hypothetical protein
MSDQYLFVQSSSVDGANGPDELSVREASFAWRSLSASGVAGLLLTSTGLTHRGTRMHTTRRTSGSNRRWLSGVVAVLLVLGLAAVAAPAEAVIGRPVITSLSPKSGPTHGGGTVTVYGRNFVRVRAVRFGTTLGTLVRVLSSTKLTVRVPAHPAGLVNVAVASAYGTSAVVSYDHYTYVAPPRITALSPTMGPDTGGTVVTVSGGSFIGVRTVTFGGKAGTGLHVNSTTSLRITTPAHLPGTVDVRVITAYGTAAIVAADKYHYTGWAPGVLPNPADLAPNSTYSYRTLTCGGPAACVGSENYMTTAAPYAWLALYFRNSSGAWSVTRAPVPSDASTPDVGSPISGPFDLKPACSSSGTCVVPGMYYRHANGGDNTTSVLWTNVGGTWTAVKPPLPNGVPSTDLSVVTSIACGGSVCVAGGGYSPDGGQYWQTAWTYDNGTWSSTTLPLPAGTTPPPLYGTRLEEVGCTDAGTCTGIGSMYSSGGNFVLYSYANGTWTATKETYSDTNAPGTPSFDSGAVTCGASSCLAYNDGYDGSTPRNDAAWMWANGSWTAIDMPAPADAGTAPATTIDRASCVATMCTAVGHYVDSAGDTQAVSWTLANGVWSGMHAVEPGDAAQNPRAVFTSLTCGADGSCLAQARVSAAIGGSETNLYRLSGGVWALSTAPWAAVAPALQNNGASCVVNVCWWAGGYTSSGYSQARVWTLIGSTWVTEVLQTPTPAYGVNFSLDGASCGPTGGCALYGNYRVSSSATSELAWNYVA